MNQVDLPDPVREDITNLQKANSELINRVLELERQVKEFSKLGGKLPNSTGDSNTNSCLNPEGKNG